MNQILSTENIKSNKKINKGGQADINTIVKFFAIVLIIFGVFMISSSSYALYKSGNSNNNTKVDASQQVENPNKQDDKEEIPEEPVDSGINIEISLVENKAKIEIDAEKEISYITYHWDDEEEEKIDVSDTTYSTEIEIMKGEHTLIVVAVDEDGNKEEKEQKITGATKPELKIEKGNDCYVIKASDEIGLQKIVIKTIEDGKETKIQAGDGDKEFEYEFPLKENSENRVEITAYNSSNVASDTIKARWKK